MLKPLPSLGFTNLLQLRRCSRKKRICGVFCEKWARASWPSAGVSTARIWPSSPIQELGFNALAVTAESPSYPTYQRNIALDLVARYGFRHEFIASDEMEDSNYVENPSNRCYFCKHELYTKLQKIAEGRGFRYVVDGNNLDDTSDYRPGRQAGRELEIRSPLIEARLNKSEIRELSRTARIENVGSTGVGLSLVAHSLWLRSHGRKITHDRSG